MPSNFGQLQALRNGWLIAYPEKNVSCRSPAMETLQCPEQALEKAMWLCKCRAAVGLLSPGASFSGGRHGEAEIAIGLTTILRLLFISLTRHLIIRLQYKRGGKEFASSKLTWRSALKNTSSILKLRGPEMRCCSVRRRETGQYLEWDVTACSRGKQPGRINIRPSRR